MNKCVIVYKSVQRIEEYRKLQLNALLVPFVLLLAMSLQPNHKSQVLTAIPKKHPLAITHYWLENPRVRPSFLIQNW